MDEREGAGEVGGGDRRLEARVKSTEGGAEVAGGREGGRLRENVSPGSSVATERDWSHDAVQELGDVQKCQLFTLANVQKVHELIRTNGSYWPEVATGGCKERGIRGECSSRREMGGAFNIGMPTQKFIN